MNPPTAAAIPFRIEENARKSPEATAVIDGGREVAFSDLVASVDRLAGWLADQDLAPGTVVGVSLRENFQHLVAALALMRIGCAQLTLSPRDPPDIRQSLADRCGVTVALIADGMNSPAGARVLCPDFAAVLADAGLSGEAVPAPDLDATAMLCASSGTTGQAKIMAISQRQILERAAARKLGAPGEVVFRPVSMDFDIAKRENTIALIGGAAILLTMPRDALDISRLSRAHGVTTLLISPGQARDLVSMAEREGARLFSDRTIVQIAGGAVSAAFCRAAHRYLSPLVEVGYGASECGTVSVGGVEMFDIDENAAGYLLGDMVVETVDEEDRPLPAGAIGRLRIRTPGMLSSYLDDAGQSALAFRDGWFYPRDVGRVTPDRLLIFEGRADEMMSLNSINIFPAEIERVVETFPGVAECAAFALKSAVHGDIPIVAIVSDDDLDHRALLDHCRRQLGMRSPRRVVRVAELPRSDAGKILRRELPALLSN